MDFIKQFIRIATGLRPNDGTGDSLRTGGDVINGNFGAVTDAVNSLAISQSAGMASYLTRAAMDADLSKPEGALAMVTNDPVPDNNTTWRKSGAPGAGAWNAAYDRLWYALGNGSGYQQIGAGARLRPVQDKLREQFTVTDFGARPDGGTDAAGPVQQVKVIAGGVGVAVFPRAAAGAPSAYKLNSLGNTDLNGLTLDVPSDVTLSLPNSSYQALKDVNVSRQTRIYWQDILCDYYPRPKIKLQRDKTNFISAGDLRQQKLTVVNASTLAYRAILFNTADAFVADAPTFADTRGYSYTNKPTGSWYGGFISLKRGETYQGSFNVAGQGQVGIMFRHAGGYSALVCDATSPASGLMFRQIKPAGGAIQTAQDVTFPGRGVRNNYNPQTSLWSVRITKGGQAVISINGAGITTPVWTTSLGDIFEVAFVWGPSNANSSFSLSDTIIEQNTDPSGLVEVGELRMFGDSTVEYMLGNTQDDLKDMLDHTWRCPKFS